MLPGRPSLHRRLRRRSLGHLPDRVRDTALPPAAPRPRLPPARGRSAALQPRRSSPAARRRAGSTGGSGRSGAPPPPAAARPRLHGRGTAAPSPSGARGSGGRGTSPPAPRACAAPAAPAPVGARRRGARGARRGGSRRSRSCRRPRRCRSGPPAASCRGRRRTGAPRPPPAAGTPAPAPALPAPLPAPGPPAPPPAPAATRAREPGVAPAPALPGRAVAAPAGGSVGWPLASAVRPHDALVDHVRRPRPTAGGCLDLEVGLEPDHLEDLLDDHVRRRPRSCCTSAASRVDLGHPRPTSTDLRLRLSVTTCMNSPSSPGVVAALSPGAVTIDLTSSTGC